jgi:hypothetical protein
VEETQRQDSHATPGGQHDESRDKVRTPRLLDSQPWREGLGPLSFVRARETSKGVSEKPDLWKTHRPKE